MNTLKSNANVIRGVHSWASAPNLCSGTTKVLPDKTGPHSVTFSNFVLRRSQSGMQRESSR